MLCEPDGRVLLWKSWQAELALVKGKELPESAQRNTWLCSPLPSALDRARSSGPFTHSSKPSNFSFSWNNCPCLIVPALQGEQESEAKLEEERDQRKTKPLPSREVFRHFLIHPTHVDWTWCARMTDSPACVVFPSCRETHGHKPHNPGCLGGAQRRFRSMNLDVK